LISRLLADFVAKVFLGWRTKILGAAEAFCARRREGPYRFIQNRSRVSVVALISDAAAEKAKDLPSRDFFGGVRFSTFATKSARNRHGAVVAACPLLGEHRKTFARSEDFRV
jgi:hypothetical protein